MQKGWFNGIRVYVIGYVRGGHDQRLAKLRPVKLGRGEYTFTAMADAVSVD